MILTLLKLFIGSTCTVTPMGCTTCIHGLVQQLCNIIKKFNNNDHQQTQIMCTILTIDMNNSQTDLQQLLSVSLCSQHVIMKVILEH